MGAREIIDTKEFGLIIRRLAYQLIEDHLNFENTVLMGLQPRGVVVAERIASELKLINPSIDVNVGHLDITFFRDDFRRTEKPLAANATKIDFIIENKNVILIDDVLFTGRTVRAGMDAMLAYGRPALVDLLVFVDRRYKRHLPIKPSYIGKAVDTISSEKVKVEWNGIDAVDRVMLYTEENI